MGAWTLSILPTNGLDRSLHAPVLVGLVFVSLFTEAFGWTYAGLVVPGYLAATFAAAPMTAVLVLIEGWLSQVGVALVARIIPSRTGAWSTAFGRERFFLYIVIAIIVRLFIEGSVVPWLTTRYDLSHNRELYSIGLVLVPLVANVFWSSGVGHAGPRLLALTGLTYLVVDRVLLQHTNFSLSRFQVANESVALHFLDTPKAYLILLVGAMLGARGNVRYGWDYNGILVPALLAVAWYEPMKLLGTAVEAVGIYLLARFLSSVRPFSRLPLVGPRRMLFVGILGFLVKLGLGHALLRLAPQVQMTEYLGFGYILPSLLAVKMWNKLRIGIVLMPTLQVSLSAFLVGNALGFALNWITDRHPGSEARPTAIAHTDDAAFAWLLANYRPPSRPGECKAELPIRSIAQIVDRWLERGFPDAADLAALDALDWEVVSDGTKWSLVVPKASATPTCADLRLAVSPSIRSRGGSVSLHLGSAEHGSPLTVLALAVAEAIRAPLVVSYTPPETDTGFSRAAAEFDSTALTRIDLSLHQAPETALRVAGSVPASFDVRAVEALVSNHVEIRFSALGLAPHPHLSISTDAAQRVASRYLGLAVIEDWSTELRRELQSRVDDLVGRSYRAPTKPEILLLSTVVLPALESVEPPSAWVLAVAFRLGYRVARAHDAARITWVLFEPPGPKRRGNATWLVRPESKRTVTIEVPAPLWEQGTLSYGIALFDLFGARHLLVSGSRPDANSDGSSDPRRAAGKDSFFQQLHETGIARGDDVLAIHAIRPDVAIEEDVVIEFTAPILSQERRARLPLEAFEALSRSGLRATYYSASTNQASIGAQFDPAFAFAERFAPERICRLWFSQRARERINHIPPSLDAFRRLIDRSPLDIDVAALALSRLAKKQPKGEGRLVTNACDSGRVTRSVQDWLKRNNPYDRLDAKRLAAGCEWHAAIDARTGIPWLMLRSDEAVKLLPLHDALALEHDTKAEPSQTKLRELVDLGISTISVEAR